MLIRLTALQQFQQSSHLAIPDEFLTFFLSESSTVGSGGDSELRRRARREARARVGFDPYDESPIKQRGEAYQARSRHEQRDSLSHHDTYEADHNTTEYDYDGFPLGTRSGASTPYSRSTTPIPDSTNASERSKSTIDISSLSRSSVGGLSSPSPLLRRATTQTTHVQGKQSRTVQPRFRATPQTPPGS
jgi:hypothetical protein